MATQEMIAMRLEAFLNRAYKLDKRIKRPSKGEYYSLTRAEEKDNYQKELKTLKNRIEQAIEVFFKQAIDYQTEESLKVLGSLNAQAKNSNDVATVIEKGLLITEQFK
ncbi:hypothetical protein ITJ86_16205 [Winogradskyella sp. F6397]|uniref:Uncharacterized protein n=2 Tax=Winogradskyella TaxID=286104 RepID=A0ABT7ZU20_9FLAO|nr:MULTISPECIES: hypothetical protein [Winogradskyella]MBF8151451.1 hypothetical protein [Winogradskyella marina]MDN3492218.1 hypothetical protein [Winogradskyella bathintestinalis]